MSAIPTFFVVILGLIVGALLLGALVWLLVGAFGLAWKIVRNIFQFIGREISDAVRLVGSIVLVPIFALLVLFSVVIGRWSASSHYGRSFGGECRSIGACVWRLVIGNPLRLLGLGGALEGVEQRLPRAIADAPGRDKPSKKRIGMFEGYKILGSLPGGGSGGKLYVAEPDELKQAALERRGLAGVDRVVIKVFSQKDGSTLDQIVRESRALEAARDLGLVLEHASEPERFYYVMRYVPGDSLGTVTQRMHASAAGDGLDGQGLSRAMGYITDLLRSLHTYHSGGLWHKDVKPENIIIDADDGRAHLVDFGLITPMRSAMTLTTHGTEYFRDPELVRQALRGVKVHQIDGAKFDVYSAGAVLFSVLENSFPAHGGLSQLKKRCPEALRWVTRRAMTEYDNRYPTVAAMLADLEFVRSAADPFALKPADLPSMRGETPVVDLPEAEQHDGPEPDFARAAAHAAAAVGAAGVGVASLFNGKGKRPNLGLKNWWSGKYVVEGGQPRAEVRGSPVPPVPPVAPVPPGMRAPAGEQIKNARGRAHARRERALKRIDKRRAQMARNHASGINRGVVGAITIAMLFFAAFLVAALVGSRQSARSDQGQVTRIITDDMGNTRVIIDGGGELVPDPEVFAEDFGEARALLPRMEGTLLVVSDLRPPVDEDLADSLREVLAQIGQSGVKLLGDFVVSDELWPEEEIEIVGRVKAVVTGLPVDAPELAEGLMGLAGEFDDVDAIFWIAPAASDADRVGVVLAGADFSWRGEQDADEVDAWLYEAAERLAWE